jgi:hypothetical protein
MTGRQPGGTSCSPAAPVTCKELFPPQKHKLLQHVNTPCWVRGGQDRPVLLQDVLFRVIGEKTDGKASFERRLLLGRR